MRVQRWRPRSNRIAGLRARSLTATAAWARHDVSVAILAALVLLAVLPVDTWDRVPSVCPWRNLFGVRCAGCGGIHAVAALLHGEVAMALRYNAFALFVATVVTAAAIRDVMRLPVVYQRAFPTKRT